MRQLIYICFTGLLAAWTLSAAEFKVAVLPDEICTLQVPLKIGFQLGIPARHNSAFYAECFSPIALQQEISALNERVEIGLLVKQQVDPESGDIIVFMSNNSEELKGVTLRSSHLLGGKSYIATATGGKIRGSRTVTLRVQAPVSGRTLDVADKFSWWRKQSQLKWCFTPEKSGSHLCTFLIEPDSEILIRGFSLLPAETLSLWRKESIDILKRTGAGSFRWPVVDGMDFYNWYDGIGAPAGRSAVQPEKTRLNHHDFGTAEYLDFCRTVGVEPLICVPLYTPACTDPRVRDLEAAAQMAADWVAYCNADNDHPLAVLREPNSLRAPLRVDNWELVVPESSGLISPAMLADGCQRTLQVMKAQDSAIRVGATLKGEDIATLDALLQRAGKQLDFVSCYAPGAFERVKAYNAANNSRIMFADTSMQGMDEAQGLRISQELAVAGKLPEDYYINWYRALGIAAATAARLGLCLDGPVCLPYYTEQVLGLDHGSTRRSTDIALLSAMIGRYPAAVPLKTELFAGNKAETLSVHPAWSEDRSMLVVFVYNPAPEPQELKLDLSPLKKPLVFWVVDQVSADFAASPPGEEAPVIRSQKAGSALNQVVECQIKGASFSRILVKE